MVKICLCKGISDEEILEAKENGAKTFEDIQEKTTAGTGGCGARRCKCKILELLED